MLASLAISLTCYKWLCLTFFSRLCQNDVTTAVLDTLVTLFQLGDHVPYHCSIFGSYICMHALHILEQSHCGYGHKLTSVGQLTVNQNSLRKRSRSAFIGSISVKLLLPKYHCQSTVAKVLLPKRHQQCAKHRSLPKAGFSAILIIKRPVLMVLWLLSPQLSVLMYWECHNITFLCTINHFLHSIYNSSIAIIG